MARRVRILKASILHEFARTVHANEHRLSRMWLVSPWICGEGERTDALHLLIESVRRRRKCDVIVVTRKPTAVWHLNAIHLIGRNTQSTVFHCDTLHTKLYIVECDGFRSAIIGSPNLTTRANALNKELAIEFRTTITNDDDDVAAIINELIEYASGLRGESILA